MKLWAASPAMSTVRSARDVRSHLVRETSVAAERAGLASSASASEAWNGCCRSDGDGHDEHERARRAGALVGGGATSRLGGIMSPERIDMLMIGSGTAGKHLA